MEFLATIPVYTYPWFYNLFLGIALIFILLGVVLILSAIELRDWIPLFISFILFTIGILGIFHTVEAKREATTLDYNAYKVSIDETIKAKDFLKQYEVLSREGEIFTIKEIEVDEE
jgi:voltage-gated potassium channel Kch